MSSLSRWSYTNTATVWTTTVDQYGQPSYGTPYTISATWADTGETQTDDSGIEFVPASTFWFEVPYNGETHEDYLVLGASMYLTTDQDEYEVEVSESAGAGIPTRGDYIAKFDQRHIADPLTAGGQQIKKVTSYDMSMFSANEIPDWEVFT